MSISFDGPANSDRVGSAGAAAAAPHRLAHLVSTMVSVDETLVASVPLPDPDAVRACVRPPLLDTSSVPYCDGSASVAAAYTHNAVTRLVDTVRSPCLPLMFRFVDLSVSLFVQVHP